MINLQPIAIFHSPKTQCLETASQGSLDPSSQGQIDLSVFPQWKEMMEGLEGFSHLWLLFYFHRTEGHWKPKVWPPRSHKKLGVFASRSPHRPNPLGMTAVKIKSIEGPIIFVEGHDLVDGTPVLDIKPYLTYADSFPEATLGWTSEEPEYSFDFSEEALRELSFLKSEGLSEIESAILQQLRFHPTDRRRKRVRSLLAATLQPSSATPPASPPATPSSPPSAPPPATPSSPCSSPRSSLSDDLLSDDSLHGHSLTGDSYRPTSVHPDSPTEPQPQPQPTHLLSYRTWRVSFSLADQKVRIHSLSSGYTPEEILLPDNPYGDKELHRKFLRWKKTWK